MNKVSFRYALLIVAITAIILSSCGGPGSNPVYTTIRWELDDNGYDQFYTNDPQYYAYGFSISYSAPGNDPMAPVEYTVKKVSGCVEGEYGILICDEDDSGSYEIQIRTNGTYSVAEWIDNGGSWTSDTIVDWTATGNLNQGYDTDNVILAEWDAANNEFDISFNGTSTFSVPLASFTNPRTGGDYGYFCAIGFDDEESFPGTPADFRFK